MNILSVNGQSVAKAPLCRNQAHTASRDKHHLRKKKKAPSLPWRDPFPAGADFSAVPFPEEEHRVDHDEYRAEIVLERGRYRDQHAGCRKDDGDEVDDKGEHDVLPDPGHALPGHPHEIRDALYVVANEHRVSRLNGDV